MAFSDTSRTCLHDQRGFTLVEALIAASTFLFILFAVYLVYEASRNTYARGEAKTDIQQNARMALSTMERELRMAGYGVPPSTPTCPVFPRIVDARLRSITIRADLRNLSPPTTLTATAAVGASSLTVNTTLGSGIAAGDVVYITDGTNCESHTVQPPVGATTLPVTSNLTYAYAIGSRILRPKDVKFTIGGGELTRDEGNPNVLFPVSPRVLAQKVADQDTFRYWDASTPTPNEIPANPSVADPSTIRRITFTLLTSDTPPGLDLQSYRMQSDVRPRNLPFPPSP